jgi:hypothetical protein
VSYEETREKDQSPFYLVGAATENTLRNSSDNFILEVNTFRIAGLETHS